MSDKYESMSKIELRAASKAAGIVYGKMNNDQMRAALRSVAPVRTPQPAPAPVVEAPKSEPVKPAKELEKGPREHSKGYSGKGLRIEKGRDESNGVKRPSAGGTCRAIWDALDVKRQELEVAAEAADESEGEDLATVPSFADLKALMLKYGWARNTAMTQYQRWKQFNGLMARSQAE